VKVAAVDIGTNTMRLLITDEGGADLVRLVEVTGLGRGVDAAGRFSREGVRRTIPVLQRFGDLMDFEMVTRRRAVATSAARDAANREKFFDLAEPALGVRPVLISGQEEANLAYEGATGGLDQSEMWVVSDIGGGSTEFVTREGAISVDIGSVRLTERHLRRRPPSPGELSAARVQLRDAFSPVGLAEIGALVGVAGTWTSLAGIVLELPEYDRDIIHGSVLAVQQVIEAVQRLSRLTLEETASIRSLDPKRAPVILAGGLIAEGVMERLGADQVLVSETDTLDAVAKELLALP
jgi:exopolyphosphatase / guanosine-5'-triphosphate,3'-diphosphate pyrophosphatase